MTLREKIAQEIQICGPLPFSRYMELCLYDPEFGYYSRNAEQFGKAGDFYTSSDVHAVFGRLLARQFDEIWRTLGGPAQIEVLELGPGRGLFAQDVLDWSEKKFPEFFRALHYTLDERSSALRTRLATTLRGRFEAAKVSLAELREDGVPPSCTAEGLNSPLSRALPSEVPLIVFANEFFDALPIEVLSSEGSLRVDFRDGHFVETWACGSADELEFLDRFGVHPEAGLRTEVPLVSQAYMSKLASQLTQGLFIAMDYGYQRQELLAGRHLGTVTAYRQHSVSGGPYEAPGEQDITAHVNFTALAAAAEGQGMLVHPLLTQSQFLMGIGEADQFADAFEECRVPQERAKVALQLKHLVTPAGMGETFQVLVGSKGVSPELLNKLSGLGFGRR